MRIFLAGATGAIGRRLVPLLLGAGHEVTGSTRSAAKVAGLRAVGVMPVVLDAFDADVVQAAIFDARPEVLIHQLTDLPQQFDPAKFAEALERNAHLRIEGTRNLIDAARAAGIRRVIAQSIAFIYAPGPEPHPESDPLAPAEGPMRTTMEGVIALEGLATGTPGIEGLVLRYGRLYGPGTWAPAPSGRTSVHVDAAAHAAFLAVSRGIPGVYNIAADDGSVSIAKARRELGWNPEFRLPPALQ
jgi:nucleoside-diphosphate-sugar epimerase